MFFNTINKNVSQFVAANLNVSWLKLVETEFSSIQDGVYALGKAHMRTTPFPRNFPNAALETVVMFV